MRSRCAGEATDRFLEAGALPGCPSLLQTKPGLGSTADTEVAESEQAPRFRLRSCSAAQIDCNRGYE